MAKVVLTFTDNDDGTFTKGIAADKIIVGPQDLTPAIQAAIYARGYR